MKASTLITALVLATAMAASPASFAGCTKAQVSGSWVMFFSNGNYCRFKIRANGKFDTANSACVNPDLGTAAPDSGSIDIESGAECAFAGQFVVVGEATDILLHFTTDRSAGAGAYYYPDTSEKGSVSAVRLH